MIYVLSVVGEAWWQHKTQSQFPVTIMTLAGFSSFRAFRGIVIVSNHFEGLKNTQHFES